MSDDFLALDPIRDSAVTNVNSSAAQNASHISQRHGIKRQRSDPETLEDLDDQQEPWRFGGQPNAYYSLPERNPFLRLHEEILHFVQFVEPTQEEQIVANDALQRVKDAIATVYPTAKLEVFGSRATNLVLPTSDWDLCAFGTAGDSKSMRKVSTALLDADVATDMSVLDKARVPIVKFCEKQSGIMMDISFDAASGPESSEFVAALIREFPAVRPLVLVLKYFLMQRDLNETYTGGIGSFLLVLMVVRVMQEVAFESALEYQTLQTNNKQKSSGKKKKKKVSAEAQYAESIAKGIALPANHTFNLGYLLFRFFELYGSSLNYVTTGVELANGGQFFSKRDSGRLDVNNPFRLSFLSPLEKEIDIGAKSFAASKFRSAFEYGFLRLSHAIREWNGDYDHLTRDEKETMRSTGSKRRRGASLNNPIVHRPKSLLALVIRPDHLLRSRLAERLDHHTLTSTPSKHVSEQTLRNSRQSVEIPNHIYFSDDESLEDSVPSPKVSNETNSDHIATTESNSATLNHTITTPNLTSFQSRANMKFSGGTVDDDIGSTEELKNPTVSSSVDDNIHDLDTSNQQETHKSQTERNSPNDVNDSDDGYDTSEEAAPKEVFGISLRRPRLIHHVIVQKHTRPMPDATGWY